MTPALAGRRAWIIAVLLVAIVTAFELRPLAPRPVARPMVAYSGAAAAAHYRKNRVHDLASLFTKYDCSGDGVIDSVEATSGTRHYASFGRDLVVDLASDEALVTLGAETEALDLLVCCAGVLGAGAFEEQSFDRFRRVIEVNLLGTARSIHATLPALRRARGQIVVLASTASLHGWPLLSAYSASKGAVENLCDALRIELASSGVGITTVFPLLVDTPMLAAGDASLPPILRGARVSPEQVVGKALAGAARRRQRVYVPRLARVVAFMHGFWPRVLDRWGLLRGLPRPATEPTRLLEGGGN